MEIKGNDVCIHYDLMSSILCSSYVSINKLKLTTFLIGKCENCLRNALT
jgi:hypothetical protein